VKYADRDGKLRDTPQRAQLHLIDGIIGGQGDGPLSTYPVQSNVMLAAWNAVCLDAVAATLMGFDTDRIPLIYRAFQDARHTHPVCTVAREEIQIEADGQELTLESFKERYNLEFAAHPNWAGHIELPGRRATTAAITAHAYED
jgi:hypothetical protein